uniref:Proline-rich transmembrane protein 1 n=1 Tax=Arion vulgaris TaxID=1028688 RepID=A0A0B7BB27_9EUPU
MAEKQDMSHKYNEGENLELDNPVYYPESSYPDSSYPASPYSEAPPYTYAPNSADPYTETPYTEAPFTNAPYIAPPYPGAPFSQYSSSAVCVEQPRPTTTIIVREAQSYMGLALFTCFCCFWPLGCVAIYKANESQNCLARGDFVGAAARARESRNYSIGSIALGIVCLAIVVIITVITPYHR